MEPDLIVSIIAGGWSYGLINQKKVPGLVIGVNDALLYHHGPLHSILSMDRLWSEHRWGVLCSKRLPTYLRRSTLKNIGTPQPKWLYPYENNNDGRTFTDFPHTLNGQNSGACAMNLAYTLRPKLLYLFGFDMCIGPEGKAHWHPPYPWAAQHQERGATKPANYAKWATHFETYAKQFALIQTKVFNVSLGSAVTTFDKISPQEAGCAR